MPIVTTDHLYKRYGEHTVVSDLNLRVPEGCVYGFLGPNGSGKSTTMKMLLSLLRPTSGEIRVFGRPMNRTTRRELLAQVGALIESPPGYDHLTGAENLRLVRRTLGLSEAQVTRAVRTVRLESHLDKRVREYSLGMKQRLGIAIALARSPRLLILDEPTNGLDPAGIEEVRELLGHLSHSGVTVMVSSHLLGEIDKTATVLGVLGAGRMLFQGSRHELLARSTPDVLVDNSDPDRAQELLGGTTAAHVEGASVRLPGLDDQATAEIVASLVRAGVDIYGVRREQQTLEDVFRDLTAGGGL